MVMFFNWVDLWLAVAIISPFTAASWGSRPDSLSQRGDRERNSRATGNMQRLEVNEEECSPGLQAGDNQGRERRKKETE